jgi:hypothetical protein
MDAKSARTIQAASVLAMAVGLLTLAGMTGCYTQLASVQPQSDITQTAPPGATGDTEEYFPSRRTRSAGMYPEDRLFDPLYDDPYYYGRSYYDPYPYGGGYGGYYDTPWWYRNWYGPGGGGRSGTVTDSTRVRRRGGRQLWRADRATAPSTPPPAMTSSGTLENGANKSGSLSSPNDSTGSKSSEKSGKKRSGRQLWR